MDCFYQPSWPAALLSGGLRLLMAAFVAGDPGFGGFTKK
jgi:hypothetical protein